MTSSVSRQWVRGIASIDLDDGVVFSVDHLRSGQIREGDLYITFADPLIADQVGDRHYFSSNP